MNRTELKDLSTHGTLTPYSITASLFPLPTRADEICQPPLLMKVFSKNPLIFSIVKCAMQLLRLAIIFMAFKLCGF